jgi:integrase
MNSRSHFYPDLLIHLRYIFNKLAWTQQLPELGHLIRRQDVPRRPRRLPRPLAAQQDQLLQQEFLRRNDLGGNAFLLIRHTGMRIGECADLSCDCLRSTGPNQWAVHVPLGKQQSERMVLVDSFVCTLVQRLRFFSSLDPLPADGLLLARPGTKNALVRQLRDYMHQVCHSLGISTPRAASASPFVRLRNASFRCGPPCRDEITRPHFSRHDHALYRRREFDLARSESRHLVPQPKTPIASLRAGLDGVMDALFSAQHVLEMFCRALPNGASRTCLARLSNRLTKIVGEARKLATP